MKFKNQIESIKLRIRSKIQFWDSIMIWKINKFICRNDKTNYNDPEFKSKLENSSIKYYKNNKGEICIMKEEIIEPKPFISPFMKID